MSFRSTFFFDAGGGGCGNYDDGGDDSNDDDGGGGGDASDDNNDDTGGGGGSGGGSGFFSHGSLDIQAALAFTSTSATGCIVTKDELEAGVWAAGENKLMLIDISVPRNVEASVNEVPGLYAYNVDDLKQVVAANLAKRRY